MNMTRGTVTHVNRGPSGHEVRRAACAAVLNALNSLSYTKLSNNISIMLDNFLYLLYQFYIFLSFPLSSSNSSNLPKFLSQPGGINPPVEPARDYLAAQRSCQRIRGISKPRCRSRSDTTTTTSGQTWNQMLKQLAHGVKHSNQNTA